MISPCYPKWHRKDFTLLWQVTASSFLNSFVLKLFNMITGTQTINSKTNFSSSSQQGQGSGLPGSL